MLQGWVVIAVALGYIGLLFLVASYGDRVRRLGRDSRARLLIYPLSLAIYCTSWTFFGSVGSASRSGYEFLAIYVGPVLMIGLFAPMIARVVRLAKAQNITSIADFIAARYGKSQAVAATVALIAIIGTVPYIALQLKAVSFSLETIIAHSMPAAEIGRPLLGDMALYVALSMALFAVLFGTRHIDATEHQDGLMLAVAAESIVKLLSFLAVGIFVTFWMFDGPVALFSKAMNSPLAASVLTREPPLDTLLASTLLSFVAILLLPRQFHVAVVENNDEREIKRARWMFPIYLVLINLFVVPIAIAGLMTFPGGQVDGDMFVLALPLQAGSSVFTILAFVGGLSAATAMVIVETVALAIMVSNDIVVPWVLQRREALITGREDVGSLLLTVRRIAIFAILAVRLPLLPLRRRFPACRDRHPGLRGHRAARAGVLRRPDLAERHRARRHRRHDRRHPDLGLYAAAADLRRPELPRERPVGIELLRPQHLFGLELPPLVHGVMWSLALNILAYIGFSTRRAPSAIERMQADVFVPTRLAPMTPSFRLWRSSVTVEELTSTVARYLGEERTRSSFESFAATKRISLQPDAEADFQLLRYAEHQLASAIGAASSRLVLSLLLAQAHRLDQGRAQAARRRQRGDPLQPRNPADRARPRAPGHRGLRQGSAAGLLEPAVRRNPRSAAGADARRRHARRNRALQRRAGRARPRRRSRRWCASGSRITSPTASRILKRFIDRGLVVEVRTNRMPDGGIVTTATDITPSVVAAEALERANATLEMRVRERTTELTRLNAELGRAKADAEEANVSKTRFLAAASHDILQPLNAARLYVTSLLERQGTAKTTPRTSA